MAYFTVIQPKRVLRIKAKSVQALTRALHASGLKWLAVHQDKDS